MTPTPRGPRRTPRGLARHLAMADTLDRLGRDTRPDLTAAMNAARPLGGTIRDAERAATPTPTPHTPEDPRC